jgi:hypothetical protein
MRAALEVLYSAAESCPAGDALNSRAVWWISFVLDDDRIEIVKRCPFEDIKSPSLRHIKDP